MRFARIATIVFLIVPLLAGCVSNSPETSVPRLGAAPASQLGVYGGRTATGVPSTGRAQLHARGARGKSKWPANASYVYVSLFEYPTVDEIDVFKQGNIKAAPIATITAGLDFVAGLFVDQSRNLWVANEAGYILEFPPGQSKPSQKIDVPASDGYPQGMWVAGDGSIYAITNGVGVIKYTTQDQWVTIGAPSDMNALTGIVGDAAGDLFVSGFVSGVAGGTVEWLPAGSSQWGSIGFPNIAEPGGVAFDLLGRLLVANAFVGNVFVYDWRIPQLEDALRCLNCAAIAMNSTGKHLWTITDANPFMLEELGYSAGNRIQTLAFEKNLEAVGMAVSPAFAPPPSSLPIRK
ncbi:MAG TPA: hypothetical protein VGF18_05925 [Candidatus Tumulicola sp.]|jgi:hypothetical protein